MERLRRRSPARPGADVSHRGHICLAAEGWPVTPTLSQQPWLEGEEEEEEELVGRGEQDWPPQKVRVSLLLMRRRSGVNSHRGKTNIKQEGKTRVAIPSSPPEIEIGMTAHVYFQLWAGVSIGESVCWSSDLHWHLVVKEATLYLFVSAGLQSSVDQDKLSQTRLCGSFIWIESDFHLFVFVLRRLTSFLDCHVTDCYSENGPSNYLILSQRLKSFSINETAK